MVSSISAPTTTMTQASLDDRQSFGAQSLGTTLKNVDSSTMIAPRKDLKTSAYTRVLDLLANDHNHQREVSLGKRIGFYKLGEELGAGNFSKVKVGAHILTKERVAIKIIEKHRMDQKAQKLLAREIQNMEETHHPNIIRLFEVVETLTKLHLVLEYAGGGELYDYVINNAKLAEDEARPLYAQVLAAVDHMHSLDIIHRDLKAENVIFAAPKWVKVGDFGFSICAKLSDELNTFCGSPPYAAPELFKDKSYHGQYVDIWALGVLLYFLVTGNTPFKGDTVSELKKSILVGEFTIPEYVSVECQDLIKSLIRMEPDERATLIDVKQHPWMSGSKLTDPYEKYSVVPSEDERDKPTVKEVWDTLERYGISTSMLNEAALRGAKNSVVGTYRIVLYQVQSRQLHELGLPVPTNGMWEKNGAENGRHAEAGGGGGIKNYKGAIAGLQRNGMNGLSANNGKKVSRLCTIV